jgi:hypothetical protein
MKKVYLFCLVISLSFLFLSCQKEKDGTVVFWFNQSTAQWLYDNQVPSCTYYIDGVDVGGMGINVHFESQPSCYDIGTITVNKSLGYENSKTFPFKVTNSFTGDIIWQGNIEIFADQCNVIYLSHQ